ncbi:uncharacterized protein LOC144823811 [Lissotriton helveticus]
MKALLGIVLLLECFNGAHLQMMAQSAAFCNLVDGNFIPRTRYGVCSCKTGSVGDGFTCTKIALCKLDTCCMPGYKWNTAVSPKACTTINQCPSTDPLVNMCTPPTTCNEINGLYTCINNKMAACVDGVPCSDPQQDCLRATPTGALQCADPCDYYGTVDGTARLSSTDSKGRFPTDRYMYGWNRYMGSKGVMMKEGCLSSGLKCGSGEPFTLKEAHPTVAEGIKSVRLQTNTATGCLLSGSIWIKACPRGYYVYKFTGSPTFEVFCTDPEATPASTAALIAAGDTTTAATTTTTTTPTTITTTPTTTTPTTTTTTPTTPTTTPTTVTTTPTTVTTTPTTPTTSPTTTLTTPTITTASTTPTTVTTTPTTMTTTATTTPTTPTTTTAITPTTATTTPTTTTTTPTTPTTTPTTVTTTPTTVTTTPTTPTTSPTTTLTTPTITTASTTPTTVTTMPTTMSTEIIITTMSTATPTTIKTTTANHTTTPPTPPTNPTTTPLISTTVSTIPATCASDEFSSGSSTCLCSDSYYADSGLSSIGQTTSLQCLESSIKLSVRKCLLESLYINGSALHLGDCGPESAIINGMRQITFTVPKASRTCGLVITSNQTHVLYSGTLVLVPNVYANILLQDSTGLKFKCAYPLNVDVTSLDPMMVTSLPEVFIEVDSVGRTTVDIVVYKNSDFTSPLMGSDSVSTSTPLYVLIEAKDLDPDRFTLMINSFWASPFSSTDLTDPVYTNYFMKDGCLYNDTVPVTLLGSSSSLQKKFQFNAFRFSGSNTIYLHSSVSLCDVTTSNCLHNCGASRRRREANQESQAVISTYFHIADDWAVFSSGGR